MSFPLTGFNGISEIYEKIPLLLLLSYLVISFEQTKADYLLH